MTIWHGYFAIEDLALPSQARSNLITALRELGPDSDPSPARLMQFRASLDGSKAIFEAAFNEDNLTITRFKEFISDALGGTPAPGQINHTTNTIAYGTVLVLSGSGGTEYLRVLLFGGLGSEWETSRELTRTYLSNNILEWEEPFPDPGI